MVDLYSADWLGGSIFTGYQIATQFIQTAGEKDTDVLNRHINVNPRLNI